MKTAYRSDFQINSVLEITIETCCNCAVQFGLPAGLHAELRRDHSRYFFCPNGHSQHYVGKSEEEKLRDELQRSRGWADHLQDKTYHLEYQRRAQKAATTRLKNRIAAGVCPCCTRTFQNLERHLKSQHPDWVGDQSP